MCCDVPSTVACSLNGRQSSPGHSSGYSTSSGRNACVWAQQPVPSLLGLLHPEPRWLLTVLSAKGGSELPICSLWLLQRTTAWGPKATGIYSPTALEATGSKSVSFDWNGDVGSATLPPEALGETSSLSVSTFWWLLVLLGLHGHIAVFSAVCQIPSLSPYKDICDSIKTISSSWVLN